MIPQKGEHPESRWNHPVCEACFDSMYPNKQPVKVIQREIHPCCSCGSRTTSGIYIRREPSELENCPR